MQPKFTNTSSQKILKGGGGVTRYWPRPKEYKIPSYRSHEGRDCEKEGNVVRLTSPSRPQTFTPLHSRALIRDHCRVPLHGIKDDRLENANGPSEYHKTFNFS